MITRILTLVLFLALVTPYGAVEAASPSIRLLTPNGGQSIEVKSGKKVTVTWEAFNLPRSSKVCIGIVPKAKAGMYSSLAPHADSAVSNTFGTCVKAKQGKGKATRKAIDIYKDAQSTAGEYVVEVTVIVETPVSGVDANGKPSYTTKINRIAYDVSDASITIKPLKDKKAGELTIYADGERSDLGLMFEKDAKAFCKKEAEDSDVVRCVWKGKEIYNNAPKKTESTPVVVDTEKAELDAYLDSLEEKIFMAQVKARRLDNGAIALALLAIAEDLVEDAEHRLSRGDLQYAKQFGEQAEEQLERAESHL